MKKLINLCAMAVSAILIIQLFELTYVFEGASAVEPVEVCSLVDEDFSFLRPASSPLISGWDLDKSGGDFETHYNTSFIIHDTSPSKHVSMTRKFITQNGGKLVFEYRYKPAEGISFQLRSGQTAAVNITTSGGYICYMNSSGTLTNLQSYTLGQAYGVKVIADISKGTEDIYINGIMKASSVPFVSAVTALDNVFISTSDNLTGDYNVSTIKIYKGYNIYERFISSVPGTFPSSEWATSGSGGTASIEQMLCATKPDIYSLVLTDTSSSQDVSVSKTTVPSSLPMVWEFKFYMPVKLDAPLAELRSGTMPAFKIATSNGRLCYTNSLNNQVELMDYMSNLWYHIKVVANPSTDKADIFINGKLKATDVSFYSNVSSLDGVAFATPSNGIGVIWLDDIMLYNQPDEPSDYVPVPQPVSASPVIVGVQSCNMWREGHHVGWDIINPYPERKPYLGFYDEGSSEVADWEIKFLVEHGIDYQLYCWFRPNGSNNNPIKDPYLGFSLHDVFFNAKYSNLMKFAIAWENGGGTVGGSSDFRNNIVPFWMEYYFKDPRYLKIDNKPVISLYNFNQLVADFGSVEKVKEETDYLRQACVQAGFDGAIILNATVSVDATELGNRKAAGIDAIYCYSWGVGEMSSHIEMQQFQLNKQKDTGQIDMMPTLSMGRDDEAWSGTAAKGKYVTPNDFQTLAKWAKEQFMQSLPEDSLGRKMVIIDNWNEYGEGHYIMPANGSGFGYLDAVRNVFTTGGSHTDIIPTESQKNRINILYPRDRVLPQVSTIPPTIPLYALKNWDFLSGREGWSSGGGTSSITASGGYLIVNSNSSSPIIQSSDNLNIDISKCTYLKIKMKNGTSSVQGDIYFSTTTEPTMDENKRVSFFISPNDTNYTEYIVDMWKNMRWTGTLKRLRLDPAEAAGAISIDYIALVSNDFIIMGNNNITDSSFEGTTAPASYRCTLSCDKWDYHTGFQMLNVTKTDNFGSVKFPVPFVENRKSFYYSAWAKLPAGAVPGITAGRCLRFCIEYYVDGVFKQKIINSADPLSDSAWSRVSGIYTIDEIGNVTNPAVYVFTDLPAMKDTYYLDDVEVRPLTLDFTSSPADGETEVVIDSQINIHFNSDMDTSTLTKSNLLINDSNAIVQGVTIVDSRNCTITMNQSLKNNQKYTVQLKNLKASNGQTLPYLTFSFTTIANYSIGARRFYKDFGGPNQVDITDTGLESGDISATVDFTNQTERNLDVSMIAALYEKDKLKSMKMASFVVPPGFRQLSVGLRVPEVSGKQYVLKQFIVENVMNLRPLCPIKELYVKDSTDSSIAWRY